MDTVTPAYLIKHEEDIAKGQLGCTHGDLTSSYGWTAQGILATLAFACLIVKRFCEPVNKRRSWLIWFFDTSKQAIGALVIHFINIILAELFEGADPCTQYIITFLLDSSVGLLIIYLGIRVTQIIAIRHDCGYLVFGQYGTPNPKAKYWIYQCLAFVAIVSISKIFITVLLQLKFWDNVRDLLLWMFALIPIPNLEVTLVVLVIPFFVNVLMFWVTDTFLTMHRNENSKVSRARETALAVVRKCKIPFKVPKIICCLSRGIEGDETNLVEVALHNSQPHDSSQA
ncbi:Store-operated calcium entry regulator STIMATE [Halotydeus destructor]|nr:Store-operated calcium entry regulator STIMATE [Halotydeus destructor]